MADPFDLLGVPPQFDLDAGAVRSAWLAQSARLHPDRIAQEESSDSETARRVAELNQARRALDCPEERAGALLKRLGGPGKEDTSLPPTFLMEIMEVREGLEAAQESGSDISEYRDWAESERASLMRRLATMFESASSGDAEALPMIRKELNVWRYLERMLEQIDRAGESA